MGNINIYWSINHHANLPGIRVEEPDSLELTYFEDKNFREYNYKACPAVSKFMNNTFVLRSAFDYSFFVNGDDVKSDIYDQAFFDRHVQIRSLKSKLFSLKPYIIFFTDEKDLEISISQPFLDQNAFTDRAVVIPGQFNIGKYFRMLDFAFHLKDNISDFKIKEKDAIYYMKAHTDRKINFKRFMWTPKCQDYLEFVWNAKENKLKHSSLATFYKYFNKYNYKKLILKEIKENLV